VRFISLLDSEKHAAEPVVQPMRNILNTDQPIERARSKGVIGIREARHSRRGPSGLIHQNEVLPMNRRMAAVMQLSDTGVELTLVLSAGAALSAARRAIEFSPTTKNVELELNKNVLVVNVPRGRYLSEIFVATATPVGTRGHIRIVRIR